jgi:hypothetical protein
VPLLRWPLWPPPDAMEELSCKDAGRRAPTLPDRPGIGTLTLPPGAPLARRSGLPGTYGPKNRRPSTWLLGD